MKTAWENMQVNYRAIKWPFSMIMGEKSDKWSKRMVMWIYLCLKSENPVLSMVKILFIDETVKKTPRTACRVHNN